MTFKLSFRANCKPMALKRPRLVRNNLVYDPSKKDKKNWLKCIKHFAPSKPLEGPLRINVEFYFPRPKNHYRSGKYSEELKHSAPMIHTFMPDIDNLSKFVLDAMNGVFYLDDRQVVELNSHKEYTSKHSTGFTLVTITEYSKKSEFFKGGDNCSTEPTEPLEQKELEKKNNNNNTNTNSILNLF